MLEAVAIIVTWIMVRVENTFLCSGGISTSSEAGVMDRTAGLRSMLGNWHIFRITKQVTQITDTLYILHYNN